MLLTLQSLGGALGLYFALIFGIPVVLLLIYLLLRLQVVEQGTVMIVERFGRFHRRCDAGLHILLPFADRPRPVVWRHTEAMVDSRGRQTVRLYQSMITRIDMRENVMDFPNQTIITRDNVQIDVHPMLLYRLTDPVRVVYETYDLCHAVEKLVQTTLRSIIGDMGLDDTLASREEIERMLMHKIKNVCQNWGLRITGVDLLEITPASSVQAAMHKQLSAERLRRAAIVSAEGHREQTKTEAEGVCQSQISLATGEQQVTVLRSRAIADARVIIAKAEAEAVRIIASSLEEFGVNATHYLIGLRYIDTFLLMSLRAASRQMLFPVHTDIVGALGGGSAR